MSEKNRQLALVFGILGVLGIGFMIYFHFQFLMPDIRRWNAETEKFRGETTKANQEITKFKALIADTSERERMRGIVEAAKLRLPSDPEELGFFELLRDSLRRTGVTTSLVSPQRLVSRELYEEIPYLVRGAARYHELGQFLNVIECNPKRLMRVQRFRVTNNDKRPSIHPVEVGIATFRFKG